ncbi:MAG TPA: DUF3301 domain-containing protein [Gammaproteobacteria bacterium]|jgi:hypothetical protein|nr:DUF3301 domain-containing protein [Gammaproteobacteria bacterium]
MYLDAGGTGFAIVLLLLTMAGFLFWNDSLQARDRMLQSCARLCRELKLQFLDETVVLTRIRFARSARGWPEFIRIYSFEFSGTGQDRWTGRATLAGRRVLSVQLDHPEGVTILGAGAPVSPDLLRLTQSAPSRDKQPLH